MSETTESLMVFHLGKYVPAAQAMVSVNCLAMRYALSVFEGIRGYLQEDGHVRTFMLNEHLLRLKWSLRLMGLPDPGVNKIPEIINELLQKNGLQEDVYIRPSVHAINQGDLNVQPVSGMTVNISRMGRKKWLNGTKGMRATISSIRKLPHDAFPSMAKCIAAYANSFVASNLARANGFDVPLLLNHAGYVSEAPTAALLTVRRGALVHAPLSDGVLPSVTAHVLCELAKQFSIPVREQHMRPEDVITSDEALLCGTGLEMAGIESLDGHEIGDFAQRPVTKCLVDAYFSLVRGKTEFVGADYGF